MRAPSRSWLKIKGHLRQEVVIAGFTEPKGSRKNIGALVVGVYEGSKLKFAGHVGGGFDQKKLREIHAELQPLVQKKSPFDQPIKTNTPVTWVKPLKVCEVTFAEWTKEGIMRQPIFMGMRDDKPSKQVVHEKAVPLKKNSTDSKTHLDKIYWPKEKYTKGDLIQYYQEVSPYILPYLKDRPEILHRYPRGIEGPSFYQKEVKNTPDWLKTITLQHEERKVTYALAQDEQSLLYLVNLGCIEMNPFLSRIKTIDKPDFLVLDLDPEDIPFDKTIEVAQTIHEILEAIQVPNFCKTSGGRGLHIYVPMGAKYSYEEVKKFALLVATLTHQKLPGFTSWKEAHPNDRSGCILIICKTIKGRV